LSGAPYQSTRWLAHHRHSPVIKQKAPLLGGGAAHWVGAVHSTVSMTFRMPMLASSFRSTDLLGAAGEQEEHRYVSANRRSERKLEVFYAGVRKTVRFHALEGED